LTSRKIEENIEKGNTIKQKISAKISSSQNMGGGYSDINIQFCGGYCNRSRGFNCHTSKEFVQQSGIIIVGLCIWYYDWDICP